MLTAEVDAGTAASPRTSMTSSSPRKSQSSSSSGAPSSSLQSKMNSFAQGLTPSDRAALGAPPTTTGSSPRPPSPSPLRPPSSSLDHTFAPSLPSSQPAAAEKQQPKDPNHWLRAALGNAEANGENIFTVVAAALEKKRVEVGIVQLRDEVNGLRSKNAALRAQVDDLEKMMDANIEDRERVIMQRNEQIAGLKAAKAELEAELAAKGRAMEEEAGARKEELRSLSAESRAEKEELKSRLDALTDFELQYHKHMGDMQQLRAELAEQQASHELKVARLMENSAAAELRWAEDIRKQRGRMEADVWRELEARQTSEDLRVREEHANMGVALRHQGALIKAFLHAEEKKKGRAGELQMDVVMGQELQSALLKKTAFLSKKLEAAQKRARNEERRKDAAMRRAAELERLLGDAAAQAAATDLANLEDEDDVDEATFNPNEATANMIALKTVSEELRAHIMGREDMTANVNVMTQFNDFVARQVFGGPAGKELGSKAVAEKMRSIIVKQKLKKKSMDLVNQTREEFETRSRSTVVASPNQHALPAAKNLPPKSHSLVPGSAASNAAMNVHSMAAAKEKTANEVREEPEEERDPIRSAMKVALTNAKLAQPPEKIVENDDEDGDAIAEKKRDQEDLLAADQEEEVFRKQEAKQEQRKAHMSPSKKQTDEEEDNEENREVANKPRRPPAAEVTKISFSPPANRGRNIIAPENLKSWTGGSKDPHAGPSKRHVPASTLEGTTFVSRPSQGRASKAAASPNAAPPPLAEYMKKIDRLGLAGGAVDTARERSPSPDRERASVTENRLLMDQSLKMGISRLKSITSSRGS